MTLEKIERLWPIAKKLHEAKIAFCWGENYVGHKDPWPQFSSAYVHNPISYVDIALAQADAISGA